MSVANLKRLVGIQFEYKRELQEFLSTALASSLVSGYNSSPNTPAERASLLNKFVLCGPSMGYEAKKFAYGTLEFIVEALVNNVGVPAGYVSSLNGQLVNVTRYVGLEGEEDFHFMVAVYNLGYTISSIIDSVGPILTLTLGLGGSDYTVDGVDEDETSVVFLVTLSPENQTNPEQYEPAKVEATIAGGVITAITAITDGGNGFAIGDVVSLEIDTTEPGQTDATGSGGTATIDTVGL
jgi:hypothetical protein